MPYYAVRIIQEVYYGSTIQCVFSERICTAVRNKVWNYCSNYGVHTTDNTVSRGRNIARDIGTRWNSWDKMLGEAITLQKAVDRFFEQYPEKELDLDRLSAED